MSWPPPTPVQDTTFTLSISIDGGGAVTGDGTYSKGTSVTVTALPFNNYVCGGWSGDISSRMKQENITMNKNYNLTATFYSKNSDCGKLIEAIGNYDLLNYYRSKISGNTEYGYIKSSSGTLNEGISGSGKILLPYMTNTIEMVHTHELEIHLSPADLTNIYNRFRRGDITDYINFKYTVVSPEYFIVIQIDDPNRMTELINNNIITMKVLDENTIKWEFSNNYKDKYYDFIVNTPNKSIEDYFKDFINFMNDINSGLKISLHKTDLLSGMEVSKYISSSQDVTNLLNRIGTCNR